MTTPVRASNTPYPVDVTAGQSYHWCACGRSQNQPFCDGSHKGTDITPLNYEATKSEKVLFCGFKQTGNPPLCDGSHKQ